MVPAIGRGMSPWAGFKAQVADVHYRQPTRVILRGVPYPPIWRGNVVVARRSVMRPNGESGCGTGVARAAGTGFRHR